MTPATLQLEEKLNFTFIWIKYNKNNCKFSFFIEYTKEKRRSEMYIDSEMNLKSDKFLWI